MQIEEKIDQRNYDIQSPLRKLIDKAPVGIIISDEEGRCTYVNDKWLKVSGRKFNEMLNMGWINAIYPDDQEKVLKAWSTGAFKSTSFNLEYRIQSPTREITWVLGETEALFDKRGHAIAYIGTISDINKRKLAEEALQESEQRLKLATASAKIGVWDLNIEDNALKWDDQMLQLYGLDRKSFGNSIEVWMNSLHPDDKVQATEDYLAALRGERDFGVEFRVVWPDGTIKALKGNAIVLRDAKGNARRMIGVNIDVTEEKKRLEELYLLNVYLQSAREVAEKATIMKSRFLDVAAHELRTPVTAFSLLLQLTQKQLERGNPVDASVLSRLKKQGDRISRLVVDLLDVSRLERGVMKLNRKPTNIVSLVDECLEDFKLRKSNRNLIFLEPKNPIEINIDSIRIYQVISNLLDNASKYTPENTPIEVIIETKPNIVRVSVKDYGPGILAKHQAELFTPFSRLSEELTDKSGGLGLGLFICRSIVELHGGKIGLNSEVGLGSTFYFELPTEVV